MTKDIIDVNRDDFSDKVAAKVIEEAKNMGVPFGVARKGMADAKPMVGEFQITSPMVDALLESFENSSIVNAYLNEKNEWEITDYTWGMTDPDDGNGCCFVPFEFQACKQKGVIKQLCIRDCKTLLDEMMLKRIRFTKQDLINQFQHEGETYDDAMARFVRWSFAFRTQRTIAQGILESGAPGLRPFQGVAQIMTDPATTPIKGSDIISGFAQAGCVLTALTRGNNSNYAIFVHPMGVEAIKGRIVKNTNGEYPADWDKGSFGNFHGYNVELKFKGVPVVADPYVPVDFVETNSFSAYIIDLSVTRATMAKPLMQSGEDAKYNDITNPDPDNDCQIVYCTTYINAGVVHCSNYAKNILIDGLPLGNSCATVLYSRFKGVLDGAVPFPTITIPK